MFNPTKVFFEYLDSFFFLFFFLELVSFSLPQVQRDEPVPYFILFFVVTCMLDDARSNRVKSDLKKCCHYIDKSTQSELQTCNSLDSSSRLLIESSTYFSIAGQLEMNSITCVSCNMASQDKIKFV